MSKVLIIGAGGVGGVVAHKCAGDADTFSEITLASRTLSRCEKIQKQVRELRGREIAIAQIDADDVATVTLGHLERRSADAATDVQDTFAVRVD